MDVQESQALIDSSRVAQLEMEPNCLDKTRVQEKLLCSNTRA